MKFGKILSKNDTGETDSHQAGIAIPKSNGELLDFFPSLKNTPDNNPDCWITCEDTDRTKWKMRYIWYNGKLHGRSTRNEYRLSHSTSFIKSWNAKSGDEVIFESTKNPFYFKIKLNKKKETTSDKSDVIKLTGWRKVY
ncbi:restriction endonuclease [Verrucomicrobia bacterium]|nr:restriction endonuclease [Verrucomicrobiota bacterium]